MGENINVSGGGNSALGLIAGTLVVALLVFGVVFFAGGFNGGGGDVKLNIETPKINTPAGGKSG